MRFAGRLVAWVALVVLDVVVFASGMGKVGIGIGLVFAIVSTWSDVVLAAALGARAFELGHIDRAARRYRYIGALAFTASRERAALLSRGGCHVAAGRVDAAERLLGQLDPDSLDGAERAVWLNNSRLPRAASR